MGNNTSQPEGKTAGGGGGGAAGESSTPHRRPTVKIGSPATTNPNNNPQHQRQPPPSRLPVLPHHRSSGHGGNVSPGGPLSPGAVGHAPNSPRRRKSLELPDLNRLSLTPTLPTYPGVAEATGAAKTTYPLGSQYDRTVGGLSPLGGVIASNPGLIGDLDDAAVPTTSPPASGSKRISLMSGTRAKSPQSGSGSNSGSGMSSRVTSMDGVPIPGASPTRRRKSPPAPLVGQESDQALPGDHSYFPAVEEKRAGRSGQPSVPSARPAGQQYDPMTPGLPNYANSPPRPTGTYMHREDVSSSREQGKDRLSAPAPFVGGNASHSGPSSAGRRPSPAKPAPAIVSREVTPNSPRSGPSRGPEDGSSSSARGGQEPVADRSGYVAVGPTSSMRPHDLVLSSLPKGSSPRKDRQNLPPMDQARREEGFVPDESAIPTPTAGPHASAGFATQQAQVDRGSEAHGRGTTDNVSSSSARLEAEVASKTREEEDGLVPTLVTWTGGGKDVYVTGTFADGGWKSRIRMERSTHDFSLMLNLPPGTHRLKFIVDDHWRCSNDLQTATDGDGNLVNWLEVESETARRGAEEDWAAQEWAQKVTSATAVADDDPRLWTSEIPPALINFQITEERALSDPPDDLPHSQLTAYRQSQQTLLSSVPVPPTLPRHLEKVILNTTAKELEGTVGGTGGDDNSILPVPNHVVLQHLTASAIKNGTLAVGTTTRYKRKYISTIFFKPVGEY